MNATAMKATHPPTNAPQRDWTIERKDKLAEEINNAFAEQIDFQFSPDDDLVDVDPITEGWACGHLWRGRFSHPDDPGGFIKLDAQSLTLIVDDRKGDVRALLAAECRRIANLYEQLALIAEGKRKFCFGD